MLKDLYSKLYTLYRLIHSLNYIVICLYACIYLSNTDCGPFSSFQMRKVHLEGLYFNFSHFRSFTFFTHFCSICPHLGEPFIPCFLFNIGFSPHLSHCLSMGKLVVGYIGLGLGLCLKTAKLHKNC